MFSLKAFQMRLFRNAFTLFVIKNLQPVASELLVSKIRPSKLFELNTFLMYIL